MVTIILAASFLVLVAFFLFSLRLLFVRGGEFRGTCAGNNPMLRAGGAACGVCGRKPGEACAKTDENMAPATAANP